MLNENIKAQGQLEIVLRDGDNNIKTTLNVPNLVVTMGKSYIASRIASNTANVMSHMEIGTNATVPDATNTALGFAVANSRTALNVSGGTVSSTQVVYTAVFGAGVGTGPLTEAGIFNAASVGSMLCRTTFPLVNKDVSDSLTISWKLTIS